MRQEGGKPLAACVFVASPVFCRQIAKKEKALCFFAV